MKRKDIYLLGDIFNFNGIKVWELLKEGTDFVIGNKYVFIKNEKKYNRTRPKSYDDEYHYNIISIIDIINGHKEEYTYSFYSIVFGNETDVLYDGIKNAKLNYEFNKSINNE